MQLNNYFSQVQPKMNSVQRDRSNLSEFYLERVGFEAKVNMRKDLKNGNNLVGRSEQAGVDIGIESMNCSRHHCMIVVSESSVFVQNLNTSNGTTVNGKKCIKDAMVEVYEHDTIGVYGGAKKMSELVGNYEYIVYRLRKFSNTNLPTIEIVDDDPFEIEDSDDENVVDPSDPVESDNPNEEFEMGIELSRNFNLELKQELRDIDEFDYYCKDLKHEPTDFFGVEGLSDNTIEREMVLATDDADATLIHDSFQYANGANTTELNSDSYLYPRSDIPNVDTDSTSIPCCSKDVRLGDAWNDDDSNDTVCFAPITRKEKDVSSNEVSNSTGMKQDDVINGHVKMELDEFMNNGHIEVELDEVLNNQYADMDADEHNEETHCNSTDPDVNLNGKLKETVTKLNCKSKTKRGPEIINAKPREKGRKSKSKEHTDSGKSQILPTTKEDLSEKLKNIATKKFNSVENKEKKKTNVKVKLTENNRGAFLTDATQTPVLPGQRKPLKNTNSNEITIGTPAELDKGLLNRKSASSPVKRKNSVDTIADIDTPVELDKQIAESMATVPVPTLNGQRKPLEKISAPLLLKRRKKDVNAIIPQPDVLTPRRVTISMEEPQIRTFEPYIFSFEQMPEPNETTASVVDPEEAEILALPPETQTVKVIGLDPLYPNLKSILKTSQNINVNDDPQSAKKCNFQIDPCHEIISNITSYAPDDIRKANGFNRTIEFATKPFVDTYDDYDQYQNTLVPLMKVELRREIEMEFTRSTNLHESVTVQVTFQNVERRGNGRRIIFHCQAESLRQSETKQLYDGHLVLVSYVINQKKVEFFAHIIKMQYTSSLGFFEMETARFTEILPIKSVDIRPITVITNTLNSFRAVHEVRNSPLLKLVLNPTSSQLLSVSTNHINYKGYDNLDHNQLEILKKIYKRCVNLDEPSISLLNGAAGTGKSTLIANLVQQLTFGDELRKPLYILICSKTNRCIDKIAQKLIALRDKAQTANTKIRLVRFGLWENMNCAVRCVSVQQLKETETNFSEYVKIENLEAEKAILKLKMTAQILGDIDHTGKTKSVKASIIRIDTLLNRLKKLDKAKLRDKTSVILNSFNVICTTLASVPKLQQYLNQVDVCIINEAPQCNEILTLLPFQFGMPSLVLVGDSQQVPPAPYSSHLIQMNYGKSLFSRYEKLFLGKLPSPVYDLRFQYRSHPEILKWPNSEFYKNHLIPHPTSSIDTAFPIMPYKVISYTSKNDIAENNFVMLLINILLEHVNRDKYSIGVICTHANQNEIMRERLRDTPFISSNMAESYLTEKDIIIIWISKEFGLQQLADKQRLNIAVTRAKKSLIVCGSNLPSKKHNLMWKSLLDDAVDRKCLYYTKSVNNVSSKLGLEKLLLKQDCSR